MFFSIAAISMKFFNVAFFLQRFFYYIITLARGEGTQLRIVEITSNAVG